MYLWYVVSCSVCMCVVRGMCSVVCVCVVGSEEDVCVV